MDGDAGLATQSRLGGNVVAVGGWAHMAIGRVKFYRWDKGWGAVSSGALPPGRDAWFHIGAVEDRRLSEPVAGEPVEFEYERAQQDSFDYRVIWLRRRPPTQ